MASNPEKSTSSPPVEPEDVRVQLERMLGGDVFRTSPRLSAFLRHVVERQLEGRTNELSEFAIAFEVFGRDSSFDSRIDSIVRVSARKLRAKLASHYEGPGAGDPVRIELPTPGYVPVFEANRPAAPSAEHRATRNRMATLAVVLLLVALVAGIAAWMRREPVPPHAPVPIVAVLPIRTLPSNAAPEPVGEAVTAEIIAELARSQGLSVIAPRVESDSTVRGEVEVDYLLEGVVVRSGDRLRLTAHVTAARSQRLRWGDSFEVVATDALGAQRQLALDVARAVVDSVTGISPPREGGPSRVPEAYALGKAVMNRWTGPAMRRSAGYFAQAIEEAPDFAPAHASHAMALRILSFMSPNPDPELLARARTSAERAIELDPELAEAHASLAASAAFEHDWSGAEQRFHRALELDANHATAHHMYGMVYLAPIGRLEEAERELRRAIELQPLSLWSHLGLVPVLYWRESYEEALDQLEHTRELAPGMPILHRFRGQVLIASGEPRSAIPELERAWERTADPAALGLLAHALAATGEIDEARQLVSRLENELDAKTMTPWSLAVAHAGLGDEDRALELLVAACDRREAWALYAAVDPMFRKLRERPGFLEIRIALNLPAE